MSTYKKGKSPLIVHAIDQNGNPVRLAFEIVDFRIAGQRIDFADEIPRQVVPMTGANRPTPAGCPRCAHALSLLPDMTERKN